MLHLLTPDGGQAGGRPREHTRGEEKRRAQNPTGSGLVIAAAAEDPATVEYDDDDGDVAVVGLCSVLYVRPTHLNYTEQELLFFSIALPPPFESLPRTSQCNCNRASSSSSLRWLVGSCVRAKWEDSTRTTLRDPAKMTPRGFKEILLLLVCVLHNT